MLTSRASGMRRNICINNSTTLQHATYLIKTQLGISDASYSHSDLQPIFGTGQGSANSHMLWCLISTILFDAYASRAHGASFQSPDGKWKVENFMMGFVDDTSGSTNDFASHDIQSP
jgi:hypothetical protein